MPLWEPLLFMELCVCMLLILYQLVNKEINSFIDGCVISWNITVLGMLQYENSK